MLCAHHERRAHNFLKEMGPKKLIANERGPSKKELNGRAKSSQNHISLVFLLLTYEQGAKQAL